MSDLLRSVWEEPRPPHPPPRPWRDWALVVVFAAIALFEVHLRPALPWPGISLAITLGLLPTLLWRRTRPLLMVAIPFGICGLSAALTGGAVPQLNALAFVLILAYSLFRWGSGREAVIGSLIMLLKFGVSSVLGDNTLTQNLFGVAVVTATAALGVAFRYRAMGRGRASSIGSNCSNVNGWPATCTTPSPTTSRPLRSGPRPASRPRARSRLPRPTLSD